MQYLYNVGLYPSILCGDFNTLWKESEAYKILASSFYRDTRNDECTVATFPGLLDDSDNNRIDKDPRIGSTIDYIFVSGFDMDSFKYTVGDSLSRDAKGKQFSISDHRPIIVSNLIINV